MFALAAMFAWGCAYPFIKLGMLEFDISSSDSGGKMLFAGIRFSVAGILTLLIARKKKQKIIIKDFSDISMLLLFGFVNTALHYYCFYSGLAYCSGGKASVINSFAPFLLIVLACVIFRERMTPLKILGCILGIGGIIVVNIGADMGGFSFAGEGMILANCVCSAFGGILTRIVTKRVEPITATGYSLGTGGIMLILAGLIAGGRLERISVKGILLLLGLIAISMTGFILYNQLLCYNPVSEIAIFNALIPVFGTLMSCIMLGEEFGIRNLLGLIFIGSGIYVVNKRSKDAHNIVGDPVEQKYSQ